MSGDRQNTSPSRSDGDGSRSSRSKSRPARKMASSGSSKTRKMTDEEQSERFIETARKLGLDEDPENFDQVMSRILRKDV